MSSANTPQPSPDLTLVRATIEYDMAVRLDDSINTESNAITVIPDRYTIVANSTVEGFNGGGARVSVGRSDEQVIIQLDLQKGSLPIEPKTPKPNVKDETVALSDFDNAELTQYERTIIQTVTTELGRKYTGGDDTAVVDHNEAALRHPGEPLLYPTPLDIISFTCRLDSDMFWEIN